MAEDLHVSITIHRQLGGHSAPPACWSGARLRISPAPVVATMTTLCARLVQDRVLRSARSRPGPQRQTVAVNRVAAYCAVHFGLPHPVGDTPYRRLAQALDLASPSAQALDRVSPISGRESHTLRPSTTLTQPCPCRPSTLTTRPSTVRHPQGTSSGPRPEDQLHHRSGPSRAGIPRFGLDRGIDPLAVSPVEAPESLEPRNTPAEPAPPRRPAAQGAPGGKPGHEAEGRGSARRT